MEAISMYASRDFASLSRSDRIVIEKAMLCIEILCRENHDTDEFALALCAFPYDDFKTVNDKIRKELAKCLAVLDTTDRLVGAIRLQKERKGEKEEDKKDKEDKGKENSGEEVKGKGDL